MTTIRFAAALALAAALISACQTYEGGADASASAPAQVSFAALSGQVTDIFTANCAKCHHEGAANFNRFLAPSGFRFILDLDRVLTSGLVVPGDPDASRLMRLVDLGAMPNGGPELSDADKAAIRAWITQAKRPS